MNTDIHETEQWFIMPLAVSVFIWVHQGAQQLKPLRDCCGFTTVDICVQKLQFKQCFCAEITLLL